MCGCGGGGDVSSLHCNVLALKCISDVQQLEMNWPTFFVLNHNEKEAEGAWLLYVSG